MCHLRKEQQFLNNTKREIFHIQLKTKHYWLSSTTFGCEKTDVIFEIVK